MRADRIFLVKCGKGKGRHYFVKAFDAAAINTIARQCSLGHVEVLAEIGRSNAKFAFSIQDIRWFEESFKKRSTRKTKPEAIITISPEFGFVARIKGTDSRGTGKTLSEALGNVVRFHDVLRLNFQTGTP